MPFTGDWINLTTSGLTWGTAANWHNSIIPNSLGATAHFNMNLPGMASNFGTRNIDLGGVDRTVGTLYIGGDSALTRFWNLTNGTLVMRAVAGDAFLNDYTTTSQSNLVYNEIDAAVRLESNTDMVVDGAGILRIDGVVSEANGAHSLEKLGTGTLHLTASNSYTLGTTITAGTIIANSSTSLGSGAVVNNGTLGFGGFSNINFANSMSGTGGLLVAGGSPALTVTLSGANSHSGSTVVQNGTLKLGANNAIGTSRSLDVAVSGTFDYNGFNPGTLSSLTGEGVITNTGLTQQTVTFSSTFDKISGLSFQGNLALFKTNTNTLTLTDASTHTGRTTVNSGHIELTGFGAITASEIYLKTGTTLDISGITNAATSVKDFYSSSAGTVVLGGKTLNITAASLMLNTPLGSPVFQGTANVADTVNVTMRSTLLNVSSFFAPVLQNWESNDLFTITGNDLSNRIYGTSGNDILNGGAFAEIGVNGNDRLYGRGGNDRLVGGNGQDYMDGGEGDDILVGGQGDDYLNGGNGIDTASYETSVTSNGPGVTVSIAGGAQNTFTQGTDTLASIENLTGSGHNDNLTGSGGNNVLKGLSGLDIIHGGNGDDIIEGGFQADQLFGETGVRDIVSYETSVSAVTVNLANQTATGGHATGDVISGFEGAIGSAFGDSLTGSTASNILRGLAGVDTIIGGSGNDIIEGGADGDDLSGGNQIDTLSYETSNAGVTVNIATNSASGGHATGDTISGFESLIGSAWADTLTGTNGANLIQGGGGIDTIDAGAGSDTVEGGAGADNMSGGTNTLTGDTLSYENSLQGVSVYMWAGNGFGGDSQGDQFNGFENLTGSAFNDRLVGDDLANTIRGLDGQNTFEGRGGNDRLYAGSGADYFEFASGFGTDQIFDFTDGTDLIRYDINLGSFSVTAVVGGAQITFANGGVDDKILVIGITPAQLDSNDILAYSPF